VVSIGFVLVLLAILLVRFVYLQAVRHSYYQTLAESNRIFVVPIVPNRGLILDRNGVELARNYSGYTLEVKPEQDGRRRRQINELSKLVEVTQKDASASRNSLPKAATRNADDSKQAERRRGGALSPRSNTASPGRDQGAVISRLPVR